jgi:hypothetical protein
LFKLSRFCHKQYTSMFVSPRHRQRFYIYGGFQISIIVENGFYRKLASNLPELREGSFPDSRFYSDPRTGTTVKLPLTSVCRVNRASHLPASTHGPEEGKHSPYHPCSGVKETDVNAGAEWVEDRIYTRRGKRPSERGSICTVTRAGSGGRGTAGGDLFT